MSIYSTRTGLHGSTMYIKDKRPIATAKVPDNIKNLLKQVTEVDDEALDAVPMPKNCLFCGEPATRRRLVNLQTVALCDEHYFNRTIGEIVAQLRGDSIEEASEQVEQG